VVLMVAHDSRAHLGQKKTEKIAPIKLPMTCLSLRGIHPF
jgi:hypothetical protein